MTIEESSAPANAPVGRGDARRVAIHDAAIAEFSTHGIRGASMARIAEGAGVSRPALYQYFANKDEIFASAFVALFEGHVEQALAALHSDASVADRLDGFLQRFVGDLWERMAASQHADEIETAKTGDVAGAIGELLLDLWSALATALAELAPGRSAAIVAQRAGWNDLLQLGPKGLRADQPSIDVYRQRLRSLAETVAADIEASSR